MKSKRTLLVFFLFFLSGVSYLFARRIIWDSGTKPPVSLVEAHEIALAALKDRHTEYFCTSAILAKTFSEGDWDFRFISVDGASTSVSIGSDRKVRISDHGFNY